MASDPYALILFFCSSVHFHDGSRTPEFREGARAFILRRQHSLPRPVALSHGIAVRSEKGPVPDLRQPRGQHIALRV